MCYEEENNVRPLGFNEAESAWLSQMSKYRDAMTNDVYSNGGLLDNTNKYGYNPPQIYGSPSLGKQILETEFTYEELSFISRCRLQNMTLPDIDRLVNLIKRYRKCLEARGLMGQDTIGTPNYFIPQYNTNVQPLYGAPVPMSIPPEWMGETPNSISRRQMNPDISNDDDVQKGPNEPDEQEEKEDEMPAFLGSVWNNKPNTVRAALSNGVSGAPEPGFKNRTHKSTTRVVLSPEGISSKDDVQKEPNETEDESGLKDRFSLKGILDYPSTGVEINENPVPLTEENKSVDKDNEKD